MTLEQLRIFVAVAERLHMTRGAEAVHVTQSAASAGIAALERRYGVNLFDRVGRGLALSEAGRVFLPEAKAVLARSAAAAETLEDVAGLRLGTLAIAASQTVSNYWLPSRMARFSQAYPGIRLSLTVGNTAQVAQVLLEGGAHLGFVEGGVDLPVLNRRRVGGDRIAIYAAADHGVLEQPVVPQALAALRWVLREPGSGTRAQFEQALNSKGIDPASLHVVLELPSNEAVLEAVASGAFVTAVSELAARPWVSAGRIAPVPFDLPERAFELLIHKDRHPGRAAAAFLAQL